MTNEIDTLKAELAALRQDLENLREFNMPRRDGMVFPAETHSAFMVDSSPAAFNFGVGIRLPGESVSAVLARADQVMYAAKGRSLRSTRR